MFAHLHVHTAYSLLDGQGTIEKLLNRAKELGQNSLAITDHGVLYGAVDFYIHAHKIGIKPILGCEVYTAARTRFDKVHNLDAKSGHLVLLAKDNVGWSNLINIVSSGFLEGFYYKPRVDTEILRKNSEGLIALSACVYGDISRNILHNNFDEAKRKAAEFIDIFGIDNFFIELQNQGGDKQQYLNSELLKLAKEINVSVVATNDVHYVKRQDAKYHDILLCIQTGKIISDINRMKFDCDALYLKSESEMLDLFLEVPEAIHNSQKIANMCNVNIDFQSIHLPEYPLPKNINAFQFLKDLCDKGFLERYGTENLVARQRLEYELNVVKNMGYVGYFLIVWDLIKYARDNDIMVGPGRGSSAGSVVSYCLKITNVDPIRYSLLFERFLNPERISMPDIDIDFCYEQRQKVIDYVIKKYGSQHVCQIITFGTMAARAAIKDVGRTLGISLKRVDEIARMVPYELDITIDKAIKNNVEFEKQYKNKSDVRQIIEAAKELEGLPRHASRHAAGVVITKEPLTTYVPLQKNGDSIISQFSMGVIEKLGLLKMDFLGLKNLTLIKIALSNIKETTNKKIAIDHIDFADTDVYAMIAAADTEGVFQMEGAGMKQFLKALKPTCFEDIIVAISTYRPGPMDQIPLYIENKNSPNRIRYKHSMLENILSVTHGCIIYQEQVMQIVRELGGYSMGRADIVRRAMAKKMPDVMEQERKNFVYGMRGQNGEVEVQGCIRRGIDEQTGLAIFDELAEFASYAFNKSHAAAYAVIAYQTAWLKHYYNVEFMAALLSIAKDNYSKISKYSKEMRKRNVPLLKIDINKSESNFKVERRAVRHGFSAIKNLGESLGEKIVLEREKNGNFKSFADFCHRISGRNLNKRSLEALILNGAFDTFGDNKDDLIEQYDKIMEAITLSKKNTLVGQYDLFDRL